MNFSDYFLAVYDYVKYAKQNGILVGQVVDLRRVLSFLMFWDNEC